MRALYGAFANAVGDLYGSGPTTLAGGGKRPDGEFDDELFDDAARKVYEDGGFDVSMLKDPRARKLMEETARVLDGAVGSSLPHEVPETLRYALENNAFVFSGFKTFHALREVGLSMLTEKGDVKPFNDFLKDVRRINARYNHNYLYAEYNHALAAAQMAAKWNGFEQDGDRYLLQYRTAGDDRVREEHAVLNGTTLPASDPFWDSFTPPNGWNCRCQVVQVRRNKYPLSDSGHAIELGMECTSGPKRSIFRYNPGKSLQLFPPKHPYYKAPKEVEEAIEEAARIENNRRLYERLKADPDYQDVEFNPENGGLKATHIEHNFDKDTGQYEKNVQDIGFNAGHAIILEAEPGDVHRKKYTEGTWNGLQFEIAGRETGTSNNIKRGLEHCADKRETEIAVLYFPKNNFNIDNFNDALRRYRGLEKLNDGQFVKFKKIICIQDGKIIHEVDM